jgi:leader peptidase (prepilin peptidase) / N-methyltransferase
MTREHQLEQSSGLTTWLLKVRAAVALPRRKIAIALILGVAASLAAALLNVERATLASIVLSFGLAWISAIDVDRLKLPDVLTMGLLFAGLFDAALDGTEVLLERAIGAAVGYAVLVLVATTYRSARGVEGLGRGDAKLLAAGGAWIGWANLPIVLLIASACALPVALGRANLTAQDRRLPFGPFIALGVWTCWVWFSASIFSA